MHFSLLISKFQTHIHNPFSTKYKFSQFSHRQDNSLLAYWTIFHVLRMKKRSNTFWKKNLRIRHECIEAEAAPGGRGARRKPPHAFDSGGSLEPFLTEESWPVRCPQFGPNWPCGTGQTSQPASRPQPQPSEVAGLNWEFSEAAALLREGRKAWEFHVRFSRWLKLESVI